MRANPMFGSGVVAVLAALVSACAPSPAPDTTAAARAGIEATNNRFMAAGAGGDAAAIAALYTDDGKIFPPGSPPLAGKPAIEDYFRAALAAGVAQVVLATDEVEGHGGTAHEVGHYELKGADGSLLDQGSYVVVWKQGGSEWRLHRDIWRSDVAPAPPAADAAAAEGVEEGTE